MKELFKIAENLHARIHHEFVREMGELLEENSYHLAELIAKGKPIDNEKVKRLAELSVTSGNLVMILDQANS